MTKDRFRPMLAASLDNRGVEALHFPLIASPKVDGIRVLLHRALGPVTRSLKPIPNIHIREQLSDSALAGLDGEIVVGLLNAPDVFQRTTSAVMSRDGKPDFTIHAFDDFTRPEIAYTDRLGMVVDKCRGSTHNWLNRLYFVFCSMPEMVSQQEAIWLVDGFEGVMLRSPTAPYKFGRSTLKEGGLVKLKRFADAEAVVVDFAELLRNQNEKTVNELGLTDRSDHKAGMAGMDTLGALVVRSPKYGLFRIGSGFDAKTRQKIWDNKDEYMQKTVTFKFQDNGIVEAPRFPIFKGFRGPE